MLLADHGVVEFDGEVHREPVGRVHAQAAAVFLDFDFALDLIELAGLGLGGEPGVADQEHKGRAGAVHDRHLGRVHFHDDIVHAHAGQGGEQVFHRGYGGPV